MTYVSFLLRNGTQAVPYGLAMTIVIEITQPR